LNRLSRGVGYGICQRLLLQICQRDPPDSHPQLPTPGDVLALPETGYKGVILIMACRNMKRADAARTKLLHWFSQQIEKVERKTLKKEDKEHARAFSRDCDVQIAELDLASFGSVVEFSTKIKQLSVIYCSFLCFLVKCGLLMCRVPYITHLVFNAGVASFKSIDYWAYLKQLFTSPLASITAPVFYKQHKGEISSDNLGWVWQSNVFGHFVLVCRCNDFLLEGTIQSNKNNLYLVPRTRGLTFQSTLRCSKGYLVIFP
jgi:3-keto steroid reductase